MLDFASLPGAFPEASVELKQVSGSAPASYLMSSFFSSSQAGAKFTPTGNKKNWFKAPDMGWTNTNLYGLPVHRLFKNVPDLSWRTFHGLVYANF